MKKMLLLAIALALLSVPAIACLRGLEGHQAYIYPVVRVTTSGGGGSGTIVYSKQNEAGAWETFVITNHHVIEEAIVVKEEWDSTKKEDVKIERLSVVYVEIFTYRNISEPTGTLKVEADIVAYSKTNDLGLIKLRYDDQVKNVAKLPAKDFKYNVLDASVSVGCSLLYPPIPATGEISRKNILIESIPFDMSTSQIIYGNSGGAMFLDDGTWIGVPSMVAASGWFVSIPITHMGLFIPFSRVYEWLDSEGYSYIYGGVVETKD